MERQINNVSWKDQKITIGQLKEHDEMQYSIKSWLTTNKNRLSNKFSINKYYGQKVLPKLFFHTSAFITTA